MGKVEEKIRAVQDCTGPTRGECSQASQHPTLLEEESEDVLSSTNASEEERKKYETVMEKFFNSRFERM